MRLVAIAYVLATGCIVTRPPDLSERPRWQIVRGDRFDGSCASARGFVRKSGKQGFGVALRLRSRADCTFAIERARLVFASGNAIAVEPPPPVALAGHSQRTAWLPVRFDNNAAWNAGDDDAMLELVTADGAWQLAIHQGAP